MKGGPLEIQHPKFENSRLDLIESVQICSVLNHIVEENEPRHDKTTRPDTNLPAQSQKLARVLKFRL